MGFVLMRCPPGASLQTLQGDRYVDDGSGSIYVDDRHLAAALGARWELADTLPEAAAVDTALDQLEVSLEAQGETVETLVEEALSQVPEERAAEARAEAHAAVLAETEAKDEEQQEAPQAHQASPRDEAPPRGARGDPRHYPTYRPGRR